MKSNSSLYLGLALLIGVGAYSYAQKPKEPTQTELLLEPPNNNNTTTPLVLNTKKLLKKGVNGQEVAKLQELIGVGNDGIFGAITENALFNLKRVKETTLDQFSKLPNANPARIGSGTTIIAKNPNGTKLHFSKKGTNNLYFNTLKVWKTLDFLEELGIVRSSDALGNWYLIKHKSGLFFFVRAADVQKL